METKRLKNNRLREAYSMSDNNVKHIDLTGFILFLKMLLLNLETLIKYKNRPFTEMERFLSIKDRNIIHNHMDENLNEAMDNLDDILKVLLGANPEVKAAIIVSIERLPLISDLPLDMDAVNATLLALAEKAATEMEKGEFEQMLIRGSEGNLLVSQNVGLIPLAKDVRLGLIFLELDRINKQFNRPPNPRGEAGVERRLKPEEILDKKKLEDIGLTVVSALPEGIDETRMAIISSALFSLALRAVILTEKGQFKQLFIRGDKGYLLILPTVPNTLLAVSTTKNIRFMDCKKAAERIATWFIEEFPDKDFEETIDNLVDQQFISKDQFGLVKIPYDQELTQEEKDFLKKLRDGDYDFFPFPYIFSPPSPPGETGAEAILRPEFIPSKNESDTALYCKHCGATLTKGQSVCHVCKNKVI